MKLFTIGLLLICVPVGLAQEKRAKPGEDFRIVFEEIEHGVETGNVGAFSSHLATQVQVSLKESESGYYSSSHAYYLLENFFKTRKVVSFSFASVGEMETTPYGVGTAMLNTKGMREAVQVYVALMKSDGRWVISEINIY